jgi:hypothetical protein
LVWPIVLGVISRPLSLLQAGTSFNKKPK